MARHDRYFWAELVAECAAGGAVADVAERHGVAARTLTWWRWKLGAERKPKKRRKHAQRPRGEIQLLPVEVAVTNRGVAAPSPLIEVAVGAAVVRFEVGTDPQY